MHPRQLRGLTDRDLLIIILMNQQEIMKAQKIDFKMEMKQMALFDKLNARVTKIGDLATAIKTMYDGLKAEKEAIQAELDALKAADAIDQDAVDAAEAKLTDVENTLAALTAVAAGTPAEVQPLN